MKSLGTLLGGLKSPPDPKKSPLYPGMKVARYALYGLKGRFRVVGVIIGASGGVAGLESGLAVILGQGYNRRAGDSSRQVNGQTKK